MSYLEKLLERRRWEEGQLELKKGDGSIVRVRMRNRMSRDDAGAIAPKATAKGI